MQFNKHLKHITCLLVLLFQTACATGQSVDLSWNIPEGETLHYEMIMTSTNEVDITPSNPPPDALEGMKEMFGDVYKDGKLSMESTSSEFIVMHGLADNAIRSKTIVSSLEIPQMGERMASLDNFAESMIGLVKIDLTIKSDGTIHPNIKQMFDGMVENPEDIEKMQKEMEKEDKEEMEEWITSNLAFPNNFFYVPPTNLKRVGDSEPFDPKSPHFKHGEIVNHKKSGNITLTDIQKDDSDHDIAVLEYTYHESGEFKDFGSTLDRDNTTMTISYNGHGYFDATAGQWRKIEGMLSADMNFVGDMSGDSKILITRTNKEPPEIKTYAEVAEEVKEKNPEMFAEPQIASGEPAPVLCDGKKEEGDDCMEDPLHRWRKLQEERVEREMKRQNSELSKENCAVEDISPPPLEEETEDPLHRWRLLQEERVEQAKKTKDLPNCCCENEKEANPDDPLHEWRFLQCVRVCRQMESQETKPDIPEKPRYEWNIRGKKDIERLLDQKE